MLTIRKATCSVAMLLTVLAIALVAAASASAASVAYLDGHEVWVATTDGSARAHLSAGEGDWTAVAQSDQGYIVGVRLEAGKVAALSNFTIWDPAGNRKFFGPLAGMIGVNSEALPLSLDITPDGNALVYGFGRCTGAPPCGTLTSGHYVLPSTTTSQPIPSTYSNNSIQWPTLVGNRILGTPNEIDVDVQDTGGIGSTGFTPWFHFGTNEVHRTDASSAGTVTASEVILPGNVARVWFLKWDALGGSTIFDDCTLNADDTATRPSVSQDGSEFAWQDAGGVKVAGVPAFDGPPTCNLTKAPVTISPSGSFPSIGPFDVAAFIKQPTPPVAPTPPTVKAPSSAKLKGLLKSGISIKVSSVTGGKATLKLTIKPKLVGKRGKKAIVIGTASATVAPGNVVKTIKLKLNKKGKSLKRKLKRKKLTLTVTIGGLTTTKSIKLK